MSCVSPGEGEPKIVGSSLTPRADVDALIRLSDEIAGDLVTPPRDADDVCPLCHSWRAAGRKICDSCEKSGETVGFPIGPPSVITLYTKPSALRDWLTRYKGRPGDDEDPYDQRAFDRAKALLGRYLFEHAEALSGVVGPVDCLVTVPSGRDRAGMHPLATLITELDLESPVAPMLKRGPGLLSFRQSAVDGFVVVDTPKPRHVLLLDDVFVTGARIFSAARALVDAGHSIAGSLVLARRVNRDWGECQQLWDRQAGEKFDWRRSPLTVGATSELLAELRGELSIAERESPEPA